jgi:signal transduction histidine kinase
MEKVENNNSDGFESLMALYEISTLTRTGEPVDEKIGKALVIVKKALECDSGSIFLMNFDTGVLEETATVGSRVDLIETTQFELGKGLSAWVAENRGSVLLPDVRKDGFRSFLSTPILALDKLIGVINLGHCEPNYFTESNLRLLDIIAGQLADTIERSRFLTELIEKNYALEDAQREIQRKQEQIVEMEKMQVIAQIAASINHEINNPLTTVIGNIELLLLRREDIDEKVEQKLRVILRESERIRDIVERFRGIKKIVTKDYIAKFDDKLVDIDSPSAFRRDI